MTHELVPVIPPTVWLVWQGARLAAVCLSADDAMAATALLDAPVHTERRTAYEVAR